MVKVFCRNALRSTALAFLCIASPIVAAPIQPLDIFKLESAQDPQISVAALPDVVNERRRGQVEAVLADRLRLVLEQVASLVTQQRLDSGDLFHACHRRTLSRSQPLP